MTLRAVRQLLADLRPPRQEGEGQRVGRALAAVGRSIAPLRAPAALWRILISKT